ncbi:uncharacterized protein PODANS_4_4180 [Podospora anserina S mat+]|uniref:Podospora anserina S mat+ genomic DNA chromosome 4, supercontig 4 n=1 Tax=Podospora anserina (strain S / ATCC MYA-4624 / DSM 980 / FGSC 10383) TaxID=515849 RepID=B2AQG9_PODAN|nr:uncharacterized protein PODANS_4_4180 [Podospora anserina S mat+]CAP67110.1 unnamed protein product [Podospora anserina S mat+]
MAAIVPLNTPLQIWGQEDQAPPLNNVGGAVWYRHWEFDGPEEPTDRQLEAWGKEAFDWLHRNYANKGAYTSTTSSLLVATLYVNMGFARGAQAWWDARFTCRALGGWKETDKRWAPKLSGQDARLWPDSPGKGPNNYVGIQEPCSRGPKDPNCQKCCNTLNVAWVKPHPQWLAGQGGGGLQLPTPPAGGGGGSGAAGGSGTGATGQSGTGRPGPSTGGGATGGRTSPSNTTGSVPVNNASTKAPTSKPVTATAKPTPATGRPALADKSTSGLNTQASKPGQKVPAPANTTGLKTSTATTAAKTTAAVKTSTATKTSAPAATKTSAPVATKTATATKTSVPVTTAKKTTVSGKK